MFATLFGDVRDGEIPRLPYLGYSLLLTFGSAGAIVLLVVALAGAGGLAQAESSTALLAGLGLPVLAAVIVVAFLAAFASLNLTAKRTRDLGLPGWTTVLLFVLGTAVLGAAVSESVASGLHVLAWLALLLLPSHAFSGR